MFNNIDKISNIFYHTRHQSNSITLRIQQQLFPSGLYLAVVFTNTHKTQTVLRLITWLYENKNVHYGTIKYNYLNTAFSPVYTIDSFITQTHCTSHKRRIMSVSPRFAILAAVWQNLLPYLWSDCWNLSLIEV